MSWLRFEERPSRVMVDRGAPVLVMLHADHPHALAELLARGEVGERVYVLAPSGWGQSTIDPQLAACSRVLIRRVPEVPASGVLKQSETRLWMGSSAGGKAPWSLRLDAEQAETFRSLFLRLFWHEAADEAWTGTRQLSFRPASERPFDVPALPRTAPLRLLGPDAALDVDPRGALVHLTGGSPPGVAPRRLWFPPGGDHHDHLARLLREGSEVLWDPQDLPDLAVGARGAAALLPGSRGRLRIELNAAQAADVARVLEQPAAWRFEAGVRLGDHAEDGARLWVSGAPEARPIQEEQPIDLPDEVADEVRAVPDATPSHWPPAQPLALKVRYHWTVVPPRVPSGAADDALVERWRKVDKDVSSRLGKVREALEASEGHRGQLGRLFSRLAGAVLGFGRTHQELVSEVGALEAAPRPSAAGPAGALDLLERLSRLEERAEALRGEQEKAEQKAREDDERDKQQAAFLERVEAANRDLPARRAALAEAQKEQLSLAEQLERAENELKAAGKDAGKDLPVRRHRLSDAVAKGKQAVQRLVDEVADLELRAQEKFEFKPPASPAAQPAQAGGRFVPPARPVQRASGVPEEALPEVGVLRSHRGQRYVVIERWEDLDRGEWAASRLKARLVAPENA
jgi:hypothetical protein